MDEAYEPVDLTKKTRIEETLAAEQDDAIIRVAKMRKRQPPKCRSKARNIAGNTVKYYSRVCVQADDSAAPFALNTAENEMSNHIPSDQDSFGDLNTISKVITDSLAEREELIKAQQQYRQSHRNKTVLGRNCKSKVPLLVSAHFHNTDFIVEEKSL